MPEVMKSTEAGEGVQALLESISAPHNLFPYLSEKKSEEIENTLKMISTQSKRLVAGAKIVCSGTEEKSNSVTVNIEKTIKASNNIIMQKDLGGIMTQGMLELCHKDILFLPLFQKCKKCGTCEPVIENEEWQGYDETYKVGEGYGLNKGSAYMICTKGEGYIYPSDDGQRNVLWEYSIYYQCRKWSNGNVNALACTIAGVHGGVLTQAQKEENARYIFDYFYFKQGWSKEAICGLLGNIQIESKMNPGAWEIWKNQTKGYGLVQWTSTDESFFKENGLNAETVNDLANNNPQKLMDIQLDYLLNSLNPGEGEWFSTGVQKYYDKLPLSKDVIGTMTIKEFRESTYDPEDLVLIFHASYERSGNDTEQLEERVKYAKEWKDYFMKDE